MPISVRFDIAPGITLEAVWTAPRVAEVRLAGRDAPGALVERWSMVDRRTGGALIEPTTQALADLAAYRLARHRGSAELLAMLEARGIARPEIAAVA